MQGVLHIELSGLNKSDLEGTPRASHSVEELRLRDREGVGRKLPQLCGKYIPF